MLLDVDDGPTFLLFLTTFLLFRNGAALSNDSEQNVISRNQTKNGVSLATTICLSSHVLGGVMKGEIDEAELSGRQSSLLSLFV